MTDSCSAMSRAVPKGTQTVALDSAKQAHYARHPRRAGLVRQHGRMHRCGLYGALEREACA